MDDGYGRVGVTITGGDECGGEDDRESSRGERYWLWILCYRLLLASPAEAKKSC